MVLVPTAAFGPLPTRVGLEVGRSELGHAEDDFGFAFLGYDLAAGDGVEVLGPRLLGRVVGVAGGLPGLHALKGDALLAEQDPKALVAEVVDHPLGDQEVGQFGQFGQAPGRERQTVLDRPRLGDFLDIPALGLGEDPGRPPLYFGWSDSKPSASKLWIASRTRSALVNVTSAIFATGMRWADSGRSAAAVCPRRHRSRGPVRVQPRDHSAVR
nr:hypothetical protein [Streptomyces virginiae]